jgi:hypothetical protein
MIIGGPVAVRIAHPGRRDPFRVGQMRDAAVCRVRPLHHCDEYATSVRPRRPKCH